MAGYSGTPLAKKLGIADGKSQRILLLGAPSGFESEIPGLPPDARLSRRAGAATPDVILAFATTRNQLESILSRWPAAMTGAQMLWIAWPKGSSGVASEINENDVRTRGLLAGLVDNKVCAIDQTWSGLRLVRRIKDRTG